MFFLFAWLWATTSRHVEQRLPNTEEARQNQLLLLPPDSRTVLLREQLHQHLVVAVHCGNPTNTLRTWWLCSGGGDLLFRSKQQQLVEAVAAVTMDDRSWTGFGVYCKEGGSTTTVVMSI
jgi:hypothetical protein